MQENTEIIVIISKCKILFGFLQKVGVSFRGNSLDFWGFNFAKLGF